MKIKAFSMLIVVFMLFSTVPLTSFAEADEVFVEHDLIDIDFEFTDLDNEAAPDGDMTITNIMDGQDETSDSDSLEKCDNAELMSLLPLEEVEAALVLDGYTEDEIKAVPLSTVLSLLVDNDGNKIEIPADARVVWAHFKDNEGNVIRDEYHEIGRDEVVDLSEFEYTTGYTMELIVGSGKQLDTESKRYIVRVYLTDEIQEKLHFDFYVQDDSERKKITVNGSQINLPSDWLKSLIVQFGMIQSDNPINVFGMQTYIEPNDENYIGKSLYLIMSSQAEKHPNWGIDIYYDTIDTDGIPFMLYGDMYIKFQHPINDFILNKTGEGYKLFDNGDVTGFFIVYYKLNKGENGENNKSITNLSYVSFRKEDPTGGISFDGNLYSLENGIVVEAANVLKAETEADDNPEIESNILLHTFEMKNGYKADDELYYKLRTDKPWKENIVKAVEGHYSYIEETEGIPDIKEDLFGDESIGYKAVYSGKGVDFTLFHADGGVNKLTVKALEINPTSIDFDTAPVVGRADPYFRMTGINQGDNGLDTYNVENGGVYNLDTYYGYGYQTLLINDADAELGEIIPKFWVADENVLEIYQGDKQFSGETVKDFPDGTLQYEAVWRNDTNNIKNYWITVAKKEHGPKLFVNGPSEREIFLDDYFEEKHDIFIANIGDEPLTGLKVELDAENVKLDDYWTVGGAKNDTLAAFTETNTNSDYSELPNVAKIRLLPDGEKKGDISGTLTISADGQEPQTIKLTGKAGNPEIVTEKINDAVKYVPYSYLIATNNMHEWNKVTFTLIDGELPEGLELRPSGEVYGVPQKTGKYTFTVRADYSREQFEPSVAEFTFEVKNNTSENVDAETDEGYEIINRVEDMTTSSYKDQVFEIEGDLDEFVALWLDGEKVDEDGYDLERGSTKVVIKEKTFREASEGEHTIAGEFRKNSGSDNGTMKKSAQNYKVTKKKTSNRTGGSGSSKTYFTVKFVTNGGTGISNKTVEKNKTLSSIPETTRQGYVFAGWYMDKELTIPYDPNGIAMDNFTLYAKWKRQFKVNFNSNGGTDVKSMLIDEGTQLSTLPVPTREGYKFDGWYIDENFSNMLADNATVWDNFTAYAKWVPDVAPIDASGFIDIEAGAWYYDDVNWAYSNGIMVGMNNLEFAPDATVTQCMVTTVLARCAGVNIEQYKSDDENWYAPYVNWAESVGLYRGVNVVPGEMITREDMCLIINNFLDYVGVEKAKSEGSVFNDDTFINENAKSAVYNLVNHGIINGIGNGYFSPDSATTRAQLAAMIHRIKNVMTEAK